MFAQEIITATLLLVAHILSIKFLKDLFANRDIHSWKFEMMMAIIRQCHPDTTTFPKWVLTQWFNCVFYAAFVVLSICLGWYLIAAVSVLCMVISGVALKFLTTVAQRGFRVQFH